MFNPNFVAAEQRIIDYLEVDRIVDESMVGFDIMHTNAEYVAERKRRYLAACYGCTNFNHRFDPKPNPEPHKEVVVYEHY